MGLRDLLVSVDRTSAGETRLRLALAVARAQRAHLYAVHPLFSETEQINPPRIIDYGPMAAPGSGIGVHPPGLALAEIRHAAERDEAAERLFEDELRANGIEGEWHFVEDEAEVTELVKAVDLAILGQIAGADEAGTARFRPEEVLQAAGRPVLVVPYAGRFATLGRRALIAWDGTREATRALNDALPLLGGAEAVTLLHVAAREAESDPMRPALERALRHLQHHGIRAQAVTTLKGDLAVSDVLLSRAADLAADLIVAGLYHHSPMREAVFGGVSRELLAHMTVPVLMSH
ncbi:MAG TPA: universal stress protein [Stellaceae bacterium]|nr:universal stress protein [Stellaceae bacterium]